MKPTNHPQVKLKGIEYLLLAIQSDPGKSQRHYLRRLFLYKNGRPSYNNGGTNNGYFTSSSYRNVVWYDTSVQNVFYYCMDPVDGRVKMNGKQLGGTKSKSAQMHLTPAGLHRANEVRKKIGLEPIHANHTCA
jgi:hypothetical protein